LEQTLGESGRCGFWGKLTHICESAGVEDAWSCRSEHLRKQKAHNGCGGCNNNRDREVGVDVLRALLHHCPMPKNEIPAKEEGF
jgi:hypothetical protein